MVFIASSPTWKFNSFRRLINNVHITGMPEVEAQSDEHFQKHSDSCSDLRKRFVVARTRIISFKMAGTMIVDSRMRCYCHFWEWRWSWTGSKVLYRPARMSEWWCFPIRSVRAGATTVLSTRRKIHWPTNCEVAAVIGWNNCNAPNTMTEFRALRLSNRCYSRGSEVWRHRGPRDGYLIQCDSAYFYRFHGKGHFYQFWFPQSVALEISSKWGQAKTSPKLARYVFNR